MTFQRGYFAIGGNNAARVNLTRRISRMLLLRIWQQTGMAYGRLTLEKAFLKDGVTTQLKSVEMGNHQVAEAPSP